MNKSVDFFGQKIIVRGVDVEIKDEDTGEVIFERKGFEVPKDWTDLSAKIVANKYAMDYENSVLDIIKRIVNQLTEWGIDQGYFTDEAEHPDDCIHDVVPCSGCCAECAENYTDFGQFRNDLADILVHQRALFNSPVLFNLGVPENNNTASACFILFVEDNMKSILEQTITEGMIFKSGSGIGKNVSTLRGKGELLSNKGEASGVCSFNKGWDSFAGVIRSGGKNRRAARLICLDADHPDLMEFIECKTKEEHKARLLIKAGIPKQEAMSTVAYQNGNHSIRVDDKFMQAVEQDLDWDTINRGDGKVNKTYKARDIFRKIAECAHDTGDPGLQFKDRINIDNPVPHMGEIRSSNPCFLGSTLISTENGSEYIRDLVERALFEGEMTKVYAKDGSLSTPTQYMITGYNPVIKVTFYNGNSLTVTENHDWFVKGYSEKIKTTELEPGMIVYAYNLGSCPSLDNLKEVPIEKIEAAGKELTYNLTEPKFNMVFANEILIWQCSEYFAIDNSSCNLSSLNLVKYYDSTTDKFNFEDMEADIKVLITSMDIIVDNADYPTEEIADITSRTRPLGLGFANLGALLMLKGLPYKSQRARDFASNIMRSITYYAYLQSIELSKKMGPYVEFDKEIAKEIAQRILRAEPGGELCQLIDKHGLRNSQLTLLAPTGTTALAMSCDSTGVEPVFALESIKTMSDGSVAKLIPRCVKEAVKNLNKKYRYTDSDESFNSEDFINEIIWNVQNNEDEDNGIFDTVDDLSWKAHIDMVAALSPCLSSGISKTVNMPNDCTIKDMEEAYMYAWKQGLKCVSVYRDGSKAMQPLTSKSSDKNKIEIAGPPKAIRHELPMTRPAKVHKFDIGGMEGYLIPGIYENGNPGELFIKVSNQGSTVDGLLDAFVTSLSFNLQHGIPLRKLVDKFKNSRFEPAGWTTNPQVPVCTSVIDYIAKWLEKEFLDSPIDITEIPLLEQKIQEPIVYDGNICTICGGLTQQSGSCRVCTSCGTGTGCG